MFETFHSPLQQPLVDYAAWADPQGPYSPELMQNLQKGLTAGADINSPGAVAGSGFPLRPESLDGTLYNLSYRMEHLKLWPQLLKEEVYNTINEYNVLRTHGSGMNFFHAEGGLPGEDDSTWERMYSTTKYMGTTRKYSIAAAMVKMAHAQAEVHQTLGGTMWLLQQLESNLFKGSSTLLSQSFNGYSAQINNVIDLRGRPLTGNDLNWGSGYVLEAPNYGLCTDFYAPVGVITDVIEDINPNARYVITADGYKNGAAGMQVKTYITQAGPIAFQPNVFLTFGGAPGAAAGDSSTRPGSPTISVAPAAGAPGAGETSQWLASDAGTYIYKVVAFNVYGRSAAVTSAAVTVDAGEKVTFSIADGSPVPAYYEIYRSTKGGAAGTCTLQTRVARDVSGTTVVTDLNDYLPGCAEGYMVQQNAEFNKFKRLLKYMKIRLGMADSSFRFMLLMYGDLVVHAPDKGVTFRNIGKASHTPGYVVS
jgi:hypothetical protein